MESAAPVPMRERTRRIVQMELTTVAQDLFVQHGYEATTVEAIAEAAGMSKRTFFRYFPSKEGLVIGKYDLFGDRLADALADRPATENVWDSLRHVLALFGVYYDDPTSRIRNAAVEEIMQSTPQLTAAYLEKFSRMQKLVADGVRSRRGTTDEHDPRPEAIVGAAFACLMAAKNAWQASEGQRLFAELFDTTMDIFVGSFDDGGEAPA